MSLDDDEAPEPEIIGWRKVINVAGPGFTEKITVTTEDRIELEPTIRDVGGLVFERYGDDDDHVEIRFDYIIARSVQAVYRTANQRADLDLGVTREEGGDERSA